jgi:hypothetical protein
MIYSAFQRRWSRCDALSIMDAIRQDQPRKGAAEPPLAHEGGDADDQMDN